MSKKNNLINTTSHTNANSKGDCKEKKTIFDVPEVRKILDKHSSTFTGSLDKKYENVKNILRIRKEATQNNIVEEQINEKDDIQKRLIKSDKALAELLQDGTELITNIRIANDRREIERRVNESEKRKNLLKDLQTESTHATVKFDLITSRWNELSLLKDPISLFEGLDHQKNKISNLMKQKDEIINNLHENLRRSDDRYYLDQEKQSFDIYCLVERIDAQVSVMKTAYRQHLELLQNTIDEGRENLRLSFSAKWTELYEYRTKNEIDKIEKEKKQTNQYENEMKKIALEHEELIRITRIQLDQDNDNLLIELENVKAEVLLNTEKLDYNYQIIQKRADENIIIRNQQKRRLGKLHEIVINLKNKIKETKCNGQQEIKKLRQEVMKLNENIIHLEVKSTNFAEINDKKYQNLWKMNEIEANQLLKELISVDKILFDQELILDWEGPLLQVYTKYDLSSYRNASELIKLESKSLETGKRINLNISTISEEGRHNLSLIKTMIKQITNRTKWLMDDHIDELLKPYTNDNEKCLVKIDNVFTALNIESMEEILLLKSYLMLYAWCPNCTPSGISTENSGHLHEINVPPSVTENLDDMSAIISSRTSTTIRDTTLSNEHTGIADHSNLMEFIGVNDTLNDNEDQPGQSINVELQDDNTCDNHCLIVDSAYILTALRTFIKDKNNTINKNDKIVTMTERVNYKYITISRLLSSEDVIMFWKRFREIFAAQKIRLWNALEKGLAQYLEILQKRDKLQKECQFLRNQNAELKHLLQRHLPTINNDVDDSNNTNVCDIEFYELN